MNITSGILFRTLFFVLLLSLLAYIVLDSNAGIYGVSHENAKPELDSSFQKGSFDLTDVEGETLRLSEAESSTRSVEEDKRDRAGERKGETAKLSAEEIFERNSERGYYFRDAAQSYESYPDQVLEDLAEQGDQIATMELIGRLSGSAANNEKVYQLADRGIAYGSTILFTLYASDLEREFKQNPDANRHSLLEAMAFLKTCVLRGDGGCQVTMDELVREYELVPSVEEQHFIEERSLSIYSQYQELRYEMGLGDFDNSGFLID